MKIVDSGSHAQIGVDGNDMRRGSVKDKEGRFNATARREGAVGKNEVRGDQYLACQSEISLSTR